MAKNYTLKCNAFVAIPLSTNPAARTESVSLKGLHHTCFTGTPAVLNDEGTVITAAIPPAADATLNQIYRCKACAAIMGPGDIAKGFEVGKGTYVLLTDDEVKARKAQSDDLMTLVALVPASGLTTALRRDKLHYVGPQEAPKMGRNGEPLFGTMHEAFEIFRAQLERSARCAIVTYNERGHEKIGMIEPLETGCLLTECFFDNEIRTIGQSGFKPNTFLRPALTADHENLGALMFQSFFRDTFDFAPYADEYVARIHELVKAKQNGTELDAITPIVTPAAPSDLLAAMRQALDAQSAAAAAPPAPAATATATVKPAKKSREKAA